MKLEEKDVFWRNGSRKAVEKGSFPRDGKWSKDKVEKAISNSETLSWVDKVCGGSKETSRKHNHKIANSL